MTLAILNLVLDIAVLLALGGTVFYAVKLSRHIQVFRDSRRDMDKLLKDLSGNIDEAIRAIEGLKVAGNKSGKDLQKIINDSRAMADELQIMNEMGDKLAARLENLTGKANRSEYAPAEKREFAPQLVRHPEKPSFFIQDRDMGTDAGMDDLDMPEELQSQAEKDLMEALRRNRKETARGAF